MSDNDTIESFNIKGLEKMIAALKEKPPVVRVGILGGGARAEGGVSNATVGAAHEYGTSTIPQRSFLRIPISEHLDKKMQESGAFNKDVLAQVLKRGTTRPWMEKIAKLAENIVLEAFDTGGFGKWPSWSPGYSNNTGMILVDSQQLRNSISSEIK